MRKSLRLSSTGLAALTKDPEPAVKSFRTRFSLTSFAKRVQRLTAEQRSAISRTGFGSLLLIPNHSLNKVFLTEMMEAWNSPRRAFVVGSGEIGISLMDVALILGLPVVGNRVALTEKEPFSDLEEQYGAARGKRKVAMATLETRLDSLGEVVSDDFVRTFLLYAIGTFLSSNDGKVDSRYLSFLENLDEVSRFAWGAAVVEDLCQWLDKRKENNVQYVGGCLVFLQTWSYEHFDIARPHLQDHDLTYPRVCRWDHSKSHQRQRGTSRFKDLHDDQVIWKLQPTSEELQIEIIKEALEFLGDNKEVRRAENCFASTSTVPGVDSELQHCISSKVHREDEANFENQVVEDSPTRLSTCAEEYREQEINLENLIVEETPPKLSICDRVHGEQNMNRENLILVDTHTPTNSNIADTAPNLSIRDRLHREQEMNHENLIVVDNPSNSSIQDGVHIEQKMNRENLIVVDSPSNLSIADEVGSEEEFFAKKLMTGDHATNLSISDGGREEELLMDTSTNLSIADEVGREEEFHAEKLMTGDHSTNLSISEGGREEEFHAEKLLMEDTSTNLSIADEVGREEEFHAEKLMTGDHPTNLSISEGGREEEFHSEKLLMEDTSTNLSIADEVDREQELNAQNLMVDDTPPKPSFYDDDLRKKNIMLEEENTELKTKIGQLVEENGFLRRQSMSNTQFEEQNDELKQLKQELESLREENKNLRLSISSFVARMDRHVLDFETNTSE